MVVGGRWAGFGVTLWAAAACAGAHSGGDAGLDAGDDAQLEDGGTDSSAPPICEGDCEISQIAGGSMHTCALLVDGRVVCWGSNERSQLGIEGLALSQQPLVVPGLPPIARLIRGPSHICALSTADELWCWGDASEAFLGRSSTPQSDWISYAEDVVDVSTGWAHTCAVRRTGVVDCWGARNGGQLGDGTMNPSLDPVRAVGLDDAMEIGSGPEWNCARTASARAACWGENTRGEIGNDMKPEAQLVPAFILEAVERVSVGTWFGCALRTSGEIRCWGDNTTGSIGNGRPDPTRYQEPSPVPILAPEGTTFTDVSAAIFGAHACALTSGGLVMCWGSGSSGQIGYGGSMSQWNEPVPVGPIGAALDDVTGITTGTQHSCAIRSGHEVWCWGDNEFGQLGDGTLENRYSPVRVVGLE